MLKKTLLLVGVVGNCYGMLPHVGLLARNARPLFSAARIITTPQMRTVFTQLPIQKLVLPKVINAQTATPFTRSFSTLTSAQQNKRNYFNPGAWLAAGFAGLFVKNAVCEEQKNDTVIITPQNKAEVETHSHELDLILSGIFELKGCSSTQINNMFENRCALLKKALNIPDSSMCTIDFLNRVKSQLAEFEKTNTITSIPEGECDISGLDKKEVIRALFNAASPLGLGNLQGTKQLTDEEIENILNRQSNSSYFSIDYLHGRPMKITFCNNRATIETYLFNRDNGTNAAEEAIKNLRSKRNNLK